MQLNSIAFLTMDPRRTAFCHGNAWNLMLAERLLRQRTQPRAAAAVAGPHTMAGARNPGVIALFDVDGTLTVPRKVRDLFLQAFRAIRHSVRGRVVC